MDMDPQGNQGDGDHEEEKADSHATHDADWMQTSGYALGGIGTNGGGVSLSPSPTTRLTQDEIRRRRLEALTKNASPSPSPSVLAKPISKPASKPASKRPPPSHRISGTVKSDPPAPSAIDPPIANPWLASSKPSNTNSDSKPEDSKKPKVAFDALPPASIDDEDADLQQALAMSLLASQPQQPPASQPLRQHPSTPPTEEEDEEFDPDLAAALKLSMEAAADSGSGTATPREETATLPAANLPPPPVVGDLSPSVRRWYESAEPTRILDIHFMLWDAGVTTVNDQQRWLAQGIDFKNARQPTPSFAQDSLLSAIICNSAAWGLTQSHGGPCGVLASLQAELMRLLLFGPRVGDPSLSTANPNESEDTSATSMMDQAGLPLHIPSQLTNHFCRAPPDLSYGFLQKTLALAMGIILARAAVQPSAARNDDRADDKGLAPMTVDEDDEERIRAGPPPAVHVVLPLPNHPARALEWKDLEPWSAGDGVGSGQSEYLVTHTISLEPSSTQVPLPEEQEELLAQSTAAFLLETNALPRWFHGSGGVLLFLMSLALSRGIPNIQGDMDDATARLTSQFGHCSQELLNLLLTGRAVSNVFDNTLRPSGELVCRGIQKRPVIGYLTQLESMRYLEVGGYYKTPRFPIWVVGSTSHFTVLFGDAACLKESASDVLLEKVRRAFKRMDGGEENGFLQTRQLGDFLDSLGLLSRVGEHGCQTLAATLEVSGAGIILWEDLWKRVSRLMTGASLASVLEWEEPAPPATPPAPSAAAPTAAPLSDEEYARRLQAELNGETLPSPPPTSHPAPQGAGRPETFGPTFQLYHYNGLRGGTMKPFRVTRLSADEAIGASVSLNGGNNNPSSSMGMVGVADGGMEDVLRTKWPSCKINWLSGDPPSID